jgi:hypothetical protein
LTSERQHMFKTGLHEHRELRYIQLRSPKDYKMH